MTQVSVPPVDQPGPGGSGPGSGAGQWGLASLIERLMDALIRKLSFSKLANPAVAVSVSGAGLLLGMLVAATAPNAETPPLVLPLSSLLPSLNGVPFVSTVMLYSAVILACLGLAGMLWAHSQGWRPDPRRLLLVSAGVVAVVACLSPVGSSDVASYAAYGRITALGGNPYLNTPAAFLPHTAYLSAVGFIWHNQVSVYGPIATAIQWFAAVIGGANVNITAWMLMLLNGAVFIGTGVWLLRTSDDPVRATLFWTANPVLIQQLVGGGHLDTIVAALAIVAIQVARRVTTLRGDVIVGILIGAACGIKIYAVLIGLGLAWPLLVRRDWPRVLRMGAVALLTLALQYSYYGLGALKPLLGGLHLITFPSPWRLFELVGEGSMQLAGVSPAHRLSVMQVAISCLWPVALLVVAVLLRKRLSADQPREVVSPFFLIFAWILVAPWVFPWYTAVAWAALTQVPRNPMTRWLVIVTMFLALCLSSGGQAAVGK